MNARKLSIVIDFLFIISLVFLNSSSNLSIFSYISSLVLILLSVILHIYKKMVFDRCMLALYAVASVIIGMNVFHLYLPYHYSPYVFLKDISIKIPVLFFYVILIIIGICTTFWTNAGFIGVEDDPKIVRRNSLLLLSSIILLAFATFFLDEWFIPIWIIITVILLRATSWYQMRREGIRSEGILRFRKK